MPATELFHYFASQMCWPAKSNFFQIFAQRVGPRQIADLLTFGVHGARRRIDQRRQRYRDHHKCPAGCADRPAITLHNYWAITEISASYIGNLLSMAVRTVLIVPFVDLLTASG